MDLEKDWPICEEGTTIIKGKETDIMYRLPNKVPGKIRIAFVGDSITAGWGSTVDDKLMVKDHIPLNGSKLGRKAYPYRIWELL